MKKLLLSLSFLALAACGMPGKGENQSCNTTPDCQALMTCLNLSGDGGVCKYQCQAGCSQYGETCQGYQETLHCDKPDGG
ncbi:MAG: hypothetical protein ACYCWW_06755 [Deltaproteobacteria bacterium]